MRSRGLVIIALVAAIGGCRPAATDGNAVPVVVLAAASTTNAMEDIAAAFQQEHGIEVQVSVGPSHALASQILAGAPADIFLSANQKWADHVHVQGHALRVRPLLTNQLVLVVPQGNPARVNSLADLLSREGRVALAGEHVPAGMYAEQALRSVGQYEPLVQGNRIARGHDVRATLSFVERGEAVAGVVYATDAAMSTHVETVLAFDPASYEQIVYPLVLLENADASPAAEAFFEYLGSDSAAAVFQKYGFEIIAGSITSK